MELRDKEINVREVIKKAVYANKSGLSPEELKMQEEAMIKIFEEGKFPAEALGLSEEFLEQAYKFAYSLYQQNKIEEASQLYRWLKMMSPMNPKYTIALIHCLIQQKKWLAAVSYLMEMAYLNPEDPMPFVKMNECLLEAGDLSGALIAINKAIDRAGDKKVYAEEKEKWMMTYEYILSLLNVDPALVAKVRAEQEIKNRQTAQAEE